MPPRPSLGKRRSLRPVAEMDGATPPNPTATMLTGLGIDEYFQRVDSSGTLSYLSDMVGSTLALADSSGALDTAYTYDPFGNVTVNGADTNPYQFTGRENDATGLYFYRGRYYSPTLQRFVSQDPIGFAGGDENLYGYVWSNPTTFRDPRGLWGIGFTLGVSGEGGLGPGTAGTSELGFGIFINGFHVNVGEFATAGAFSGVPGTEASLPNGSNNLAAGGGGGAGVSLFFTNASCVSDLSKTFRTKSVDLGVGPLQASAQIATGYNSAGDYIFQGSFSPPAFGASIGAGASSLNTYTQVIRSWSLF